MLYYIGIMIGASLLAFTAWLIVFRDQQRTRLIVTSIWLFAVPITLLVLDNYLVGLLWSLPLLAIIALEEGLKLTGSRITQTSRSAFALVLLFGVWEVLITKTLRVLFQGQQFQIFLDQHYLEYSLITLMPLLMHSTTAAVYAVFKSKNWMLPFALGLLVHGTFNYTRHLYFFENMGQAQIVLPFALFDIILFGGIFLLLRAYGRRTDAVSR